MSITETMIKEYKQDELGKWQGMRWSEVAEEICKDRDLELIDINPQHSLVDTGKMALVLGKGTDFSFREIGGNVLTTRFGFIYMSFERTVRFVEVMDQ